MKLSWAKVLVCLFAVAVLAAIPASAQVTTGSVTGTAVDASGAVIPGATVRLTNQDTGVTREVVTGDMGEFSFQRVRPGIYTVSVSKEGFKTYEVKDLNVVIGKVTALGSVTLQVGAAVETVTVEAGTAPLMQSESAQISGNYSARQVTEEMLGTFGIDVLAFLTPGIQPGFGNINSNTSVGEAASFNAVTNAGNSISANGLRSRFTNFTLDGQENNDISIGGPNFFVDIFDSVGEYQISTNQFNADQGRNLGATVNIVTKSGTNEHHGTLYWFHGNDRTLSALSSDKAQACSEPGSTIPCEPDKFLDNQWGFTWGGPFIKDKLFGFGSYQGIHQHGVVFEDFAPFLDITPAGIATLTAAGFGGSTFDILTTNGFAIPLGGPVCKPGTTVLFPTSGRTAAGAAVGPVNAQYCAQLRNVPFTFKQWEPLLKLDWVGKKNTAGGRFQYARAVDGPFDLNFNGLAVNIPFTTPYASFYHTIQLSPRMLNEFRFSFGRLHVAFEGANTFPFNDIQRNLGFFNTRFPFNVFGLPTNIPQDRFVNNFQFSDNWSLVWGRHTFKAGIDVRRNRTSVGFLPFINGSWRAPRFGPNLPGFPFGSGMSGFLRGGSGAGRLETVTVAAGNKRYPPFETDQFYYFQDDIRLRPNLTLNLGLRYENTGQPVNGIHKETLARESNPSAAFWLQTVPLEERVLRKIPSDKNNWAPRIGFAYTPRWGKRIFGEDKTVIRGGYGIAYDLGFYNILLNVATSAPRVFNSTFAPLAPVPVDSAGNPGTGLALAQNPLFSPLLGTRDPRLFNWTIVSGELPSLSNRPLYSPYAQQWSLGIQREIHGTVGEIRYVGTHGIGLYQSHQANPRMSRLIAYCTALNNCAELVPGTALIPNPADPDRNGTIDRDVNGDGVLNRDDSRLDPFRRVVRNRCNCARSQYHGLQMRWDFRNLFNQLTGGVGYTWSHNIDNSSEIFNFSSFSAGSRAFAPNPVDLLKRERGRSNFDIRHYFTFHFIWDIPFHKEQQGALGKVAGGWELTGTGFLFSGRPWTPFQSASSNSICNDLAPAAFGDCRPFVFNPNAPLNSIAFFDPVSCPTTGFCGASTGLPVPAASVHWVVNDDSAIGFPLGVGGLFRQPFGTGRNTQVGDNTRLFNLGIFKNTYVGKEKRMNIQMRWQFVNLFNHRNFGIGETDADDPDFFADVTKNNNAGRIIRFGLRVVF